MMYDNGRGEVAFGSLIEPTLVHSANGEIVSHGNGVISAGPSLTNVLMSHYLLSLEGYINLSNRVQAYPRPHPQSHS